jgi:hypothetical protein
MVDMIPDVWSAGIDGLRSECRSQHLLGSVLQEVQGQESLIDFFPGCRLFRVDSEILLPGNDRGAIQRYYVVRPDDERAYQLHRDSDVVALARAEDVRLDSEKRAVSFATFALGVSPEDAEAARHGSAWVVDGTTDTGDGEPLGIHVILRMDREGRLVDVVRVGQVDASDCGEAPRTRTAFDGLES